MTKAKTEQTTRDIIPAYYLPPSTRPSSNLFEAENTRDSGPNESGLHQFLESLRMKSVRDYPVTEVSQNLLCPFTLKGG